MSHIRMQQVAALQKALKEETSALNTASGKLVELETEFAKVVSDTHIEREIAREMSAALHTKMEELQTRVSSTADERLQVCVRGCVRVWVHVCMSA